METTPEKQTGGLAIPLDSPLKRTPSQQKIIDGLEDYKKILHDARQRARAYHCIDDDIKETLVSAGWTQDANTGEYSIDQLEVIIKKCITEDEKNNQPFLLTNKFCNQIWDTKATEKEKIDLLDKIATTRKEELLQHAEKLINELDGLPEYRSELEIEPIPGNSFEEIYKMFNHNIEMADLAENSIEENPGSYRVLVYTYLYTKIILKKIITLKDVTKHPLWKIIKDIPYSECIQNARQTTEAQAAAEEQVVSAQASLEEAKTETKKQVIQLLQEYSKERDIFEKHGGITGNEGINLDLISVITQSSEPTHEIELTSPKQKTNTQDAATPAKHETKLSAAGKPPPENFMDTPAGERPEENDTSPTNQPVRALDLRSPVGDNYDIAVLQQLNERAMVTSDSRRQEELVCNTNCQVSTGITLEFALMCKVHVPSGTPHNHLDIEETQQIIFGIGTKFQNLVRQPQGGSEISTAELTAGYITNTAKHNADSLTIIAKKDAQLILARAEKQAAEEKAAAAQKRLETAEKSLETAQAAAAKANTVSQSDTSKVIENNPWKFFEDKQVQTGLACAAATALLLSLRK